MGFDVASSITGWAATNGREWRGGILKSPVVRPFDLKAGSIDANYSGAIGAWFEGAVLHLLKKFQPSHVGVEQPMPGSSKGPGKLVPNEFDDGWAGHSFKRVQSGGTRFDTTHLLHGLAFLCATACRRELIDVRYIASQTWRSTTGVGRPPATIKQSQKSAWYKAKAMTVCGLLGIVVRESDHAEAALLTHHLYSLIKSQDPAAPAGPLFAEEGTY
jgi:hypothetical protein